MADVQAELTHAHVLERHPKLDVWVCALCTSFVRSDEMPDAEPRFITMTYAGA